MKQENKMLKWKLIVQSFLPLSILVVVKNAKKEVWESLINFFKRLFRGELSVILEIYKHPHTWMFLLTLISTCVALSGLIAIWQFHEVHFSGFRDAGERVEIEEEITDSGITFFMTFILPLMMDNVTSLNDFIVYIGIVSLVIILMAKTNLYYQNPVLTLLGYKLYRVSFINPNLEICKNKKFVAVCRYELNANLIVKWKYISDNICLMYNKL